MTAHDAVDIVAQRNGFHPVRLYLTSLRWDGVKRLHRFAQTYLGSPPDAHYQAAPLRWFISAVRRVFEPGCQSDSILVLEGNQGLGKSRLLRTLASDPWFADEIGDPSNKDAAEALRGKWLIEIGELRWKRSDEDTRKAFISRRIDHYRPAYGRRAVDIPRQCSLAASTNTR
jgi:putative DNA primase/helicase